MKIYRLTIKLDTKGSIIAHFSTHDKAFKSARLLEHNEPDMWESSNAHISIEEIEVWETMVDLR